MISTPNFMVRLAQCLLVTFLALNVQGALDLEKYFRCHQSDPNFNKCMIDVFNELQPKSVGGVPELGIEPFDPLYVPKMTMDGLEGMKFKQVLTDVYITGMKDSKLIRADFTKIPQSIDMTWEVPELRVRNNYTMDGVIMGMPMKGKGEAFFNCTFIRTKMRLKTELVKINDVEHLQVKDVKYSLEAPKTAKLRFTNVMSKDKKLTEATTKLFNDNWRPMFDMFKKVRNGHVETMVKDNLNKLLAAYPYDKLFPK